MLASHNNRTLVVGVALAVFVACYVTVIASLVEVWSVNYLYSYGFAVPLIAAYLVVSRTGGSAPAAAQPDYLFGVPVTLTGSALLVVGRLAAMATVQQISLVVTLAGLVLLLWGRQTLKTHAFALVYLLLMIPIWSYPIALLQGPSRLLSARIATEMLHVLGIPALRQGTNIFLPTHTLAVMPECSGMNQLIALTAMVVPATYLWLSGIGRRIALLAFAVVVSYIGNGARITLVGWLAVHGLGDGDPMGRYHLIQGLFVSAFVYLAIGAAFSLLARAPRTVEPAAPSEAPAVPAWPVHRRVWVDVLVLLTLVAASTARLSATTGEVRLDDSLRTFDAGIGDWMMEVGSPPVGVRLPALDDEFLGAYPSAAGERHFTAVDDELVRTYRKEDGARVHVYVGYYRHQQQEKELAGEAANALQSASSAITVQGSGGPITIREIVRERSSERRGLLYWYDVNGRIAPDLYRAKSYTLWNAVTRRRTNGAIVMIAWESTAAVPAARAREEALEFARLLVPALGRRLPS